MAFNRKANVTEKIAGHEIVAPQLGRSTMQWQRGSGTDSDGQDTNSKYAPTRILTSIAKSIIIYFSRSGSTELLAAKLADRTGADLLEIVAKNPYPGRYLSTLSRANQERESDDYPELMMDIPDLSQYDTVFLGYPIWAMTLSHPMVSFLSEYGSLLNNKRIIPFMSQGSYGQGDSVQRIGRIMQGHGVNADIYSRPLVIDGNKVDQADLQISQWLKRIN